jgi:hypothetical protein
MLEVSPEFKAALQNGYESDYKLRSLRKDLAKPNTKLPYEEANGLMASNISSAIPQAYSQPTDWY